MSSEGVVPSALALPDIVDIDTKYLHMTAKEFREHTVRDFLSRPIIVSTPASTWDTSQPQGTEMVFYNFPDAMLGNTMYQEKLAGFVGLRATLNVKVQVNSQPFQAGRLMIQYIPYAQYMSNRVSMINATLQGRSGCPRTDLDLGVGTEAIMQIPYVSPHAFYNLITGQGSFGRVGIVVYSPLKDVTSGTSSVEYTVWAWLTDVDIQYPTGMPLKITPAPTFTDICVQGGVEETLIHNQNAPSVGVGKIAAGLSDLSRIPILGNMFTKPAWISTQASNLLRLLGYSKPTTKGDLCETKLRGQIRMANFDGIDASHKLALASDNEIETQPGLAGTSVDEMAISRIVTVPNYWDTFTWSDTATSGIIWQNWITPLKIKQIGSTTKFATTHMGYVANMFGLWRGSMVYTFKFVKTQFHSGRLQISFIPYCFDQSLAGTQDTNKCYRTVVDLRDSNEVSFTVPYISSRPWMACVRPESDWLNDTAGGTGYYRYNCVTGIIQVEIINQLKATSTVVGPINVIVEIAGGSDLKFANPTCPNYIPSSTATDEEDFIVVQGFMGTSEAVQRNDAQLGQMPQRIDQESLESNWAPEALCTGEKITSVRQLIKRFGKVNNNLNGWTGQNSSEATPRPTPTIMISPCTTRIPDSGGRNMPQIEYWWLLFGFWRGSQRWKIVSEVANNDATGVTYTNVSGIPVGRKTLDTSWTVKLYCSMQQTMYTMIGTSPYSTPATAGLWTVASLGGGSNNWATVPLTNDMVSSEPSTTQIFQSLEGALEFEVPYYNISHITPAILSSSYPLNFPDMYKGNTPPCVVTATPRAAPGTQNVINCMFYRAAGDDFSFHYLLGVPPLVNITRPF